jgi:hypothetical protein
MFAIENKAKPNIGNVKGLNMAGGDQAYYRSVDKAAVKKL